MKFLTTKDNTMLTISALLFPHENMSEKRKRASQKWEKKMTIFLLPIYRVSQPSLYIFLEHPGMSTFLIAL
jgi:hypothetical protein